jgi:HAD superfamily hydrolase (TIGR01509 family)
MAVLDFQFGHLRRMPLAWDAVFVLRAALIDVGGTLWPERGPYVARQQTRLREVFPDLDEEEFPQLIGALNARTAEWESPTVLEQDTDALIEAVLSEQQIEGLSALQVRQAMCVPASVGAELFPGAIELLRTARELGLRNVLVSNTAVRDAEAYWRDFEYFGVHEYIDGIVTSLDVKFRKPHEAMFRAAVQIAGCRAEDCAFIGDSEEKDIAPAVQRGMRTVLVAIEQPSPAVSEADAVATSLEEVTQIVRAWVAPKDVR